MSDIQNKNETSPNEESTQKVNIITTTVESNENENKDSKIIISTVQIKTSNDDIHFDKELMNIKEKGNSSYEWSILKKFFLDYYKKTVETFPKKKKENETISNVDDDIIEYMTNLNKIPFTLQRMAELLIEPTKYYKNANKYNNAFKKLVNIDYD